MGSIYNDVLALQAPPVPLPAQVVCATICVLEPPSVPARELLISAFTVAAPLAEPVPGFAHALAAWLTCTSLG